MADPVTDPFLDLITRLFTTQDRDTSGSTTADKSGTTTSQTDTNTTTDTAGRTTANSTQTTNGTSTVQNTADVANLMTLLQRQMAGPTAEQLGAIFSQGARQVPGLIAATATAAGGRASSNSGLQLGLRDLNADLTNQAAMLQRQYLTDAVGTAGQIADLTKSQTTSNNSTTTGSTVTDTSQRSVTDTNQQSTQTLEELLKQLSSGSSSDSLGLNGTNIGGAGLISLLNALTKDSGGLGGLLSGGADWLSQLLNGGGTDLTDIGFTDGIDWGNIDLGGDWT